MLRVDDKILEFIQSLTLLCIEDNKTTQLIYDSIFEDYVEKIIFADDGQDGYDKYDSSDIDIIITDYDMPRLNGLKMIEKIRKSDQDIPIILVTAIDEADIIIEALNLNVNNFIKKPIKPTEVINALISTSKLLLIDEHLQRQRNSKLEALEQKDKYISYQEELAFEKELNILRNDFYYKMISMSSTSLVDFMYQPLDVLSGDAYSARIINSCVSFYLLVDGMGKGLSASLSSMLITSFINHTIDNMQDANDFDLNTLIEESLKYIKPILLEDEALSVDFILHDDKQKLLYYAKFAMPAILMQNKNQEVKKLKSNNTPISRYINGFNISTYDTTDITKFLFCTDGMVENSTRFKDRLYIEYIEKDFLDSFTKEALKARLLWKIDTPSDDITFIFINNLDLKNTIIAQNTFITSLDEIENANKWYTTIWESLSENIKLRYDAGIVFTELYMNAYEHGNLCLDAGTKHKLIEDDKYLETLQEKQKDCTKNITVTINKIIYDSADYIITQIQDEGDGFDTEILSKIFRNTKSFNGRGVFVSRNSSLGIYYNYKGNSVLFLHKV